MTSHVSDERLKAIAIIPSRADDAEISEMAGELWSRRSLDTAGSAERVGLSDLLVGETRQAEAWPDALPQVDEGMVERAGDKLWVALNSATRSPLPRSVVADWARAALLAALNQPGGE